MSVNLSARNLIDVSLPEELPSSSRETGVPAHLLELEITESDDHGRPEAGPRVWPACATWA